jgi:hypothetical protein
MVSAERTVTEDKGCRDLCATRVRVVNSGRRRRSGSRLELLTIAGEFAQLPPVEFPSGWQEAVAKQLGVQPGSLLRCFIDVDGEPLVDRLVGLCRPGAG